MIKANDPKLRSWLPVAPDSDFPIQNLPFGIFKTHSSSARAASIIGDRLIDLSALHSMGLLAGLNIPRKALEQSTLNDLIGLGKSKTNALRQRLSDLLNAEDEQWNARNKANDFLHHIAEAQLLMPVQVRDYTDFYSSIEHATNVGSMFRDPENALLPNWRHIPVGYHGRASSIVVSGTDIRRPKGQTLPAGADQPVYGPSSLLDFELEMAFVVGKGNELGTPIPTGRAEEHIFGLMLFNDWSARDIQKWEYVPLGPFLGKSFASTVSPWIVTLEALEPFRVAGPKQEPAVLPYLQIDGKHNFDIDLEVAIQTDGGAVKTVCRSNFKYMYWSMCQQLAHHTVNGCNLGVGDMCASGTISGPTPDSYGSMLEISWRGTKPVAMPDGSERKFIHDGDSVLMQAHAEREGVRIGFGEVSGKVLAAL